MGILLGQPLGNSGSALPSGGLSPCARDAGDARELLAAFFSVVRQPDLTAAEHQERALLGLPPIVRTSYAPHAIEAAAVTGQPFTFHVQFLDDPNPASDDDRRKYPHLKSWYVIRCDAFEYVNRRFGRFVSSSTAYPFGDIPQEATEFVIMSWEWVPQEDGDAERRAIPADSIAHITADYLNRLPLATLPRPIEDADELEAIADFLYKIERIPLSGFNQVGELIRRDVMETDEYMIVEDEVLWTIYDDIVPINGEVAPPKEHVLLHVILYEKDSRRVVHYRLPSVDSDRYRPHVRIRTPGDGLTLRVWSARHLILRGSAAHRREILQHEQMRWYSSVDGPLGTGLGAVVVPRDQLSPGEHEITFRVCDSNNRCGEDSVRIQVPQR